MEVQPWGAGRGTPEPTDPLAIIDREIPVPCAALPHLSPTISPVLASHRPLQGARSAPRASQSRYWFFPRLALQSLGTAPAGRGAARVCLGTLLQVRLNVLFNPYMPNSC